jgi:hypothetical protein
MLPLVMVTAALQQTPISPEDGFVSLSSDAELPAWRLPRPGAWECQGGVIRRLTGGTLFTRAVYEDFSLRLEYRIDKGMNSGVFVRAPLSGRHSALGMEVQVQGDHGRAPGNETSGALYAARAPLVAANRPDGEWNALEVQLLGRHVHATLNDQVIHDFDLDDPQANEGLAPGVRLSDRCPRGFIGLQDHGNPVEFRNVRIKVEPEPGFEALTDGWVSYPPARLPSEGGNGLADGVIRAMAPAEGTATLRHPRVLGDCEIRLEFRAEAGGQALLLPRTDDDPRHQPLEIVLGDDTGRAPGREASGSLLGVASTMMPASLPVGEWNDLRVVLCGWTVRVYLNEMPVLDVPSANLWGKYMYTPLGGAPALVARRGRVDLRNVRVKAL